MGEGGLVGKQSGGQDCTGTRMGISNYFRTGLTSITQAEPVLPFCWLQR